MRAFIYKLFVCVIFVSTAIYVPAQDVEIKKQNLRGHIIDRTSGNGLPNAYIELLNHSPRITALSDENGAFELENVPVGYQRVRVELKGFYESVHSELVVSGKQPVVTIAMDEEVEAAFITVEADRSTVKDKGRYRNEKMETVDEMNPVSARAFNIEEVTKYVGGLGDPARIVTNFPGMFNVDDSQNFIVSRGNSPYGIEWMVEGVPVENPHHLATMGNTGGIFQLLNNNLLDNSDFVNGALTAQYGNVYAGIFDVNLRKGNNQRYEFLAQFSPLGVELMAEGPFKKKGASFMISARAGILELLQYVIDVGSNATPHYYDVNFKVDIPTKRAGHFSIFGIGGISDVSLLNENIDTSDLFSEQGLDLYIYANFGLIGAKHKKFFGKQTSLTTTLSYLIQDYRSHRDTIYPDSIVPYFDVYNMRQRAGLSSVFNKKFTSKFVLRAGVSAYLQYISIRDRWLQRDEYHSFAEDIHVLASGFAQAQYKFSPRFVLTLGLQGMYWSLNQNSWSLEPRFALNWYVGARHKLSLGYGWHSKIQSYTISFFVKKQPDGTYNTSNRELGPTRSHHAVLSYDVYLAKYWGLKANIYAQYNNNIAVQQTPNSISLANHGAFTIYPELTNWETTGETFGYGAELSVEKFFSHGYYGLLSGAYQRAFYRGSDHVWRNSAFDVQYIATTVMGKEFKIGKKKRNVIYMDVRFNMHGGLPYTPINLEASRIAGEEVLEYDKAYSERLGMYKRLDVRIGARFNQRKKRVSHHIYVEAMNVANFRNDLTIKYDANSGQIVRAKQFGFVPNLFYQIRF